MKLRKVRDGAAGAAHFFKAAYDCVLDPGQVDFIWINRDQKSFEWFVSLLTKLEMDQADEEPEGERQLPPLPPMGQGQPL